MSVDEAILTVRDLTMAFGDRVVMEGLDFTIRRGEIYVVMGGSGCGKSTLLRHMLGLQEPASGEVLYGTESFTAAGPADRERLLRRVGVLYQGAALWTSMTLAENVALPLQQFTRLPAADGEVEAAHQHPVAEGHRQLAHGEGRVVHVTTGRGRRRTGRCRRRR